MSQTLFIRADASAQIGTGHVMRCLALAETWQRAGGRVVFFSASLPFALEQKLADMQIAYVPVSNPPSSHEDADFLVANAQGAGSVVLDGYHFDEGFQRRLKEAGLRLLVIDDFARSQNYCADFVLDQNFGTNSSLYKNRTEKTHLLLGPRYVLLRQEFLKWQNQIQNISNIATKILVTLGGSDPENVTSLILRALQEMKIADFEATVVVGGSNPHYEEIKTLATTCSFKVHLRRGVSNMAELMAETDFAIAAGGTTSWELAFMGVPCATIVLAENQRGVAQALETAGISKNLGWHAEASASEIARKITPLLNDDAARTEMSGHGRILIDGFGSFRVWLHLNENTLTLREAKKEDAKTLWSWANQLDVRAVSFSSDPIPWEKHLSWFDAKLRTENCRLWIASDTAKNPIGQIRFDIDGTQALVSIGLDESARGKNYGPLLIWSGSRRLFQSSTVDSINAFIKPDNQKSIRAFLKAGFKKVESKTVNGQEALVFQLWRGDLAE